MDKLKEKMIRRAVKRYKHIYPCGEKNQLSQCFTTMGNTILFWFNTKDHTTKLITSKDGKIQVS
ncbi:hypothetical protein CHISP_1286 [Chitinispirillum alkaliphilum]|nr:hypothetical protein CHISP_1286 [Chitinispirillum alkaliphilum]